MPDDTNQGLGEELDDEDERVVQTLLAELTEAARRKDQVANDTDEGLGEAIDDEDEHVRRAALAEVREARLRLMGEFARASIQGDRERARRAFEAFDEATRRVDDKLGLSGDEECARSSQKLQKTFDELLNDVEWDLSSEIAVRKRRFATLVALIVALSAGYWSPMLVAFVTATLADFKWFVRELRRARTPAKKRKLVEECARRRNGRPE